jgi:CBS domain containing-hemolysin-like protein
MGDLFNLGIAAFLVFLNGFFVAAEFAIVKVRATRIEELVRDGNRRAKMARHLIQHLDAYLSATQVGITIASLGLGWVGDHAVGDLVGRALGRIGVPRAAVAPAIAFAIITFFHVVAGELAPKSLAIQRAEKTALWTAPFLRLFYILMWPVIEALNRCASLLIRAVGLQPAGDVDLAHSAQELRLIVEASEKSGELNPQEKQLLENALQFSERLVREIMIPRPDMVCLYTTRSLEENLAIARESRHTRYPLAVEDKDHISGMIHVRDLIDASERARGNGEPLSLEKLRRPMLFVPEVATIDRVLKLFQRGRSHLAVVVDEYGGIAGLVTLEDVLEELVGEIRDEFDIEERDGGIAPGAGGEVLVEAGLPLHEVAESLKFEPSQATVDTIGGYVLQVLGRLPKLGESVRIGRFNVEVAEMDGLRVTRLRFRPIETAKGAAPRP